MRLAFGPKRILWFLKRDLEKLPTEHSNISFSAQPCSPKIGPIVIMAFCSLSCGGRATSSRSNQIKNASDMDLSYWGCYLRRNLKEWFLARFLPPAFIFRLFSSKLLWGSPSLAAHPPSPPSAAHPPSTAAHPPSTAAHPPGKGVNGCWRTCFNAKLRKA